MHPKVSIVGAGQVGMATATTLLSKSKGRLHELVLMGRSIDKVQGEVLDLQQALEAWDKVRITAASDYGAVAGSDIVIVAVGVRQEVGESRMALASRNIPIFKEIIPKLTQGNNNSIFIIATNPVDVMTYAAWKISGIPHGRIIGTGTILDTARFQRYLAEGLDTLPSDIAGYVIGEHGDSSVWSSVTVSRKPLGKLAIDRNDIQQQVVQSAARIISLKGYTSWAIGSCITRLVMDIISNRHTIHPLSINVKGHHGINHDLFLSLPCVVGKTGILKIKELALHDEELSRFRKSAEVVLSVLQEVKLS